MDEKKRRQKELEDKRKKLQAYKDQNKKGDDRSAEGSPSSTEATKTPAQQGLNLQSIHNLDDLLSSIEKVIPASASKSIDTSANNNNSPNNIDTTAATPSTTASVSSPKLGEAAVGRRRMPKLSIQYNVVQVDIPPKEVEVYSKGTQTTETSAGDSTEFHQEKSHESIHSESSLKKKSQEKEEDKAKGESKSEESQEEIKLELTPTEKEKVIQAPEFVEFIDKSSRLMERALYVGKQFDITIDYAKQFDEDKLEKTKREVTLQTKLFDERWSKHRSVTDVGWSPNHTDLVIASYSSNETGTNDPDGVVLVWSVQNTLQRPEYRFHCQSQVMTAFFSKFSPTLIIGGTYSGQVVLWDIRARSTPVQHTPLSSIGHTHPVYSMDIVGTKNAHSLVSVSTDGKLCVWSLENLLQPQEVLELHNKQSKPVTATAPVAVTCMNFPEGEVNEFYVGSEEGAVYQAYRHGSKSGVSERFEGHVGPITGVHFHPASGSVDFSDLFLTSSTDWTCKLWNRKSSTKPLYSFEDADDYIYDAQWSPTHPAVFATVNGTGNLDLWNLNEETEIPIIKTNVGPRALNQLKWSADGRKILTGDSAGTLYIYDTGEIAVPGAEEWQKFDQTLQKLSFNLTNEQSFSGSVGNGP